MRTLCLSLAIATLGCASRGSVQPRVERRVEQDRSCFEKRQPTRRGIDLQGLAVGPSSLPGLILLRKTVVQVNDHYYEPSRIHPERMLRAIVDAWVAASNGELRLEGDSLVVNGAMKTVPRADTIWQIPLALQDVGRFLSQRLPPENPLTRGAFAEYVATNAMLSTLDWQSWLAPPGVPVFLQVQMEDPEGRRLPEPVKTLDGGALYLRPGRTLSGPGDASREKLQQAPAAGVLLDLRRNSGGRLEDAESLLELLIRSGTMVTYNGRDFSRRKDAHDDGLPSERVKMVVLVDRFTASAGEIVAGALRFADRALIVGEPTFGAGLVQEVYELDRTAKSPHLMLSAAEVLLPGDRAFDGLGVGPDVLLSSAAGARTCPPLGAPTVTIPANAAEPDQAVAIAEQILRAATGPSRAELLRAATAIAAGR